MSLDLSFDRLNQNHNYENETFLSSESTAEFCSFSLLYYTSRSFDLNFFSPKELSPIKHYSSEDLKM